jgi:hypothetical protein
MTADQILELVSFPLHLTIAEEGIDQVIDQKALFPSGYLRYSILGIGIRQEDNMLQVHLKPAQTLEQLGYSFEMGV